MRVEFSSSGQEVGENHEEEEANRYAGDEDGYGINIREVSIAAIVNKRVEGLGEELAR